jgi:two-component system sensor histidine kinase AlgZ
MRDAPGHYYLPDFCAGRSVAVVLLVCQLLAFVVVASSAATAELPAIRLLKVSLFLHWLGLMSALTLCATRPLLVRLSVDRLSAAAFLLVIATTALLSLGAWHALRWAGYGVELGAAEGSAELAFVLRNAAIAAIVTAVLLRYLWVQHQWRRNVELEARSRVEALTARIRPHFLFNSMNTIAALIRSRPADAERAVEDLADLFRASLADARVQVALEDELALARGHLRMEQLRLGERLKVEWRAVDAPSAARVPRLLLQPLVENAVRHGIEPLPGGGTVSISVRAQDGALVLEVENPRPAPGAALPIDGEVEGNRMALANIRQRLELVYGSKAALAVHEEADRFVVMVRIPLEVAP